MINLRKERQIATLTTRYRMPAGEVRALVEKWGPDTAETIIRMALAAKITTTRAGAVLFDLVMESTRREPG